MDDLGLGNGGAAAVITSALGKIENSITAISAEQVSQRDLLTRFDERQRGWATKHEVSETAHKLEVALAPVAAQAAQAHIRLDTLVGSLATLGGQLNTLDSKVDSLIVQGSTKEAEQRGSWKVLRPTLAWLTGIAAAVVAAFAAGRVT